MNVNETIPYTEKYRPCTFDSIILNDINSKILSTILNTGNFPNMLFYGPPGTGKTTTIMNLIKTFLETFHTYNKELIMHLNASDDRGVDTIRNQVQSFVNSSCMFQKGIKFVVLDEVDYMTKIAQQSLQSIMNNNNKNIRYCLICNYISKIETNLKNELIILRFNNLPSEKIFLLLSDICEKEKLNIDHVYLKKLQHIHHSDIRSMLNVLQNNQHEQNIEKHEMIELSHIHTIHKMIESSFVSIDRIEDYMHNLSYKMKSSTYFILMQYIEYLLCEVKDERIWDICKICKQIVHSHNVSEKYYLNYFFHEVRSILMTRH